MSGFRVSILKSYFSSRFQSSPISENFGSYGSCMKFLSCNDGVHARALIAFSNRRYHTLQSHRSNFLNRSSSLTLSNGATVAACPTIISCSYVSFFWGKGEKSSAVSGTNSIAPGDWVNQVKDAWKSTSDAAFYTGEKVKEVSNVLTPYARRLLDSHPYLDKVVIPATCTMSATVIAWLVMPRVLRRFHKYAQHGLHSRGLFGDHVPYENSIWGAMEDPVRYLITFIAFSQIGMMIAPTSIASTVIPQVWRGSVILSFVWFLQRWKTNVFGRSLAVQNVTAIDREKLLTLDKLSSVALFSIGLMAFAEACGVAVQSILTVGGIGGVATAFAARDVLGNVLSGLSLQFSKPFSLGDTIKAGTIEGQVLEMGLTTTSLLNAEKLPVIVPNSLFSSQVIVNKSRAQWRAMVTKIPLQMDGLEKIPQICDEIMIMLKSKQNVFLGTDAPYCFLSRIENCFAELTLGCNLQNMSKGEWHATEQDILIHAARIIQRHGVSLGSTQTN